jgi:DNA-directed RNA polymerase subunit beta'
MLVPPQKETILDDRREGSEEIEQQYVSGLVTAGSATTRWSTSGATPEAVGKAMMDQLSKDSDRPRRQRDARSRSTRST